MWGDGGGVEWEWNCHFMSASPAVASVKMKKE